MEQELQAAQEGGRMSFGMMKIEQDFLEVMVEYVPRIAQALEKIAEGAKDSTTGGCMKWYDLNNKKPDIGQRVMIADDCADQVIIARPFIRATFDDEKLQLV